MVRMISRRYVRSLIGAAMLVGLTTLTIVDGVSSAEAIAASRPSTPGLGDRTRQWRETVKSAAKKIGAATQDAAHHVAAAAVHGAHVVASESKAGYAQIKAKVRGKGKDGRGSTSGSSSPH